VSFREKSVAATLVALLVVYGGYFATAFSRGLDAPAPAIDGALVRTVGTLISLLIVFHILIAVFDHKQKVDERDRMITLIGDRNGGYVAGFGALGAMLMLLAQLAPGYVIHVLLGAMVLGEIVKIVTQLYLYRRGV
jgi:hypothetical protein